MRIREVKEDRLLVCVHVQAHVLLLVMSIFVVVVVISTVSLSVCYYEVSLLHRITTCNVCVPMPECVCICKTAGSSSPLVLAFPLSLSPSVCLSVV